MSQEKLNEELAAVEAALSSLRPTPSGLDRDRVMFLAGRKSAGKSSLPAKRRPAAWLWPCATAVSLLVAVTFGGMLLVRGEPQVVYVERDRDALGPRQKEPAPTPYVDDSPRRPKVRADYLKLRRLVLSEGIDAMPPLKSGRTPRRDVPTWTPGHIRDLETILGG